MAVDYFADPPSALDLNESRTTTNNAIGIVLFALSAIFVGLRSLTKLRLKRERLGLDDYLMLVGLVLSSGNLACCIAGGFYGLGKHIWTLNPYSMRKITIITFAYVYIYAWSVCVIKFSILAFYRRIFGMTWLGWFCVTLTAGYLIANHVVLPLYTRPLNYYWNQWHGAEGVVVINEAKFYLGIGIVNLVGDICILAVPISRVIRMHLARSQKIAISMIFLLGSLYVNPIRHTSGFAMNPRIPQWTMVIDYASVCFASMYRIITISRLVETTDISWAKSDVFIWSSVEPSVGIISACLPTLRPLMLHIMQSWFNFIPSERSSTGKGSRSISLNHNETIGKRRVRKVSRQDTLGSSQFTELNDYGDIEEGQQKQRSRVWGPDDHGQYSTRTTVEARRDSRINIGRSTPQERDDAVINVTRNFEWDEATRR